ncbi:MAG: cupin domain-containing protein [Chloroflexi bacterium]|nr:cupin domain-containing protein [Chloroflexota bacterium]
MQGVESEEGNIQEARPRQAPRGRRRRHPGQGQGLSEHTAPFDALVYVVEGQAQVTISGTAHSTEAGQILLMPANEPHALRAIARFKMLLVMVRS